MSDENNNGRNSAPGGRQPLTLKPRAAGSVSSGTVKQSFSHGRTKTVVVETKRARPHVAPGGNLAAPSAAERRVFEPAKPAASSAPQAPRAPQGAAGDGLSAEERAARQRAIELARQQEAERRAREERARAEAEAARAAQAAAPKTEP
ncbi:IF-2-associated domain-containing protein, partial [Phenylobacterium sp.]